MRPFGFRRTLLTVLCVSMSVVPALAQGITQPKQGQGGSVVKGAAGTEGSTGDKLEHCVAPMGAMAVVEPQDYVLTVLTRYNLRSPVGLIRMMIQQSNCFIVVERGVGMQNMMQERALADRRTTAQQLQRGRRADSHCGLHPDARRGVLREQRRRRRRCGRWAPRPQGARGRRRRRRAEVQGSADQHARGRRAKRRAGCRGGGQHEEGRPRRRRRALRWRRRCGRSAATATPMKARSSPPRSWTTTTRSSPSCATTLRSSARSVR